MKVSSLLTLLIIPFFLCASDRVKIHCYKVVDGDTIYGVTDDGDTLKVRLWGIDCPERGQPFGDSATQFVRMLCEGRSLYIERRHIDRYGRVVATVLFEPGYIDIFDPNVPEIERYQDLVSAILNHGLGWWDKRYAPKEKGYKYYHKKAKKDKMGLWVDNGGVAPWEWRKMSKEEREIRRRIFKRGSHSLSVPVKDAE